MTTKKMTSFLYGSLMSAGLALLPLSTALAQEAATGTLTVNTEVIAVCSVDDATLNFGQYDANSASEGETSLVVECTTDTSVTVSLGEGTGGDPGQRQMSNGAERLNYDLYKDQAREIAFDSVATMGTPGGANVPLYGLIPDGQPVPIGDYNDSVLITVAY